jgi:hypothetical protein
MLGFRREVRHERRDFSSIIRLSRSLRLPFVATTATQARVMVFDSLEPVAQLAAGLARRSAGFERAPAPASEPKNPAEVLARLLDFSGSVELAKLIHTPVPEASTNPRAAELGRKLQDKVLAQLDALTRRAVLRLARERDDGALDLAALQAAITRAAGGLPGAPQGLAAARLARALGSPLHAALGSSLRQARSDLFRLRTQIALELRGLGPRAVLLERVDAELQSSIEAKLGDLLGRLVHAAEQSFERACSQACQALPEGFGELELLAWLGEGGFIERHGERCLRMTQAFCGHLQRGLEGLVTAAIQAEVQA